MLHRRATVGSEQRTFSTPPPHHLLGLSHFWFQESSYWEGVQPGSSWATTSSLALYPITVFVVTMALTALECGRRASLRLLEAHMTLLLLLPHRRLPHPTHLLCGNIFASDHVLPRLSPPWLPAVLRIEAKLLSLAFQPFHVSSAVP